VLSHRQYGTTEDEQDLQCFNLSLVFQNTRSLRFSLEDMNEVVNNANFQTSKIYQISSFFVWPKIEGTI
jgi:hypothetical protein